MNASGYYLIKDHDRHNIGEKLERIKLFGQEYVEPGLIFGLVVFGITANMIALRVFYIKKRLRKFQKNHSLNNNINPNFLLSVLMVTDSLYLVWFLLMRFPNTIGFTKSHAYCSMCLYALYSLNFISNWCTAFYNIERFCIIYYPSRRFPKKTVALIVVLLAVVNFIYVPFLFTAWPNNGPNGKKLNMCFVKPFILRRYVNHMRIFVLIKYFFDSLLPFCLTCIANVLIYQKLKRLINIHKSGLWPDVADDGQTLRLNCRSTSIYLSQRQKLNRERQYLLVTIHLSKIFSFYFLLHTFYLAMILGALGLLGKKESGWNLSYYLFYFISYIFSLKFALNLFVYAFDRRLLKCKYLFGGCFRRCVNKKSNDWNQSPVLKSLNDS